MDLRKRVQSSADDPSSDKENDNNDDKDGRNRKKLRPGRKDKKREETNSGIKVIQHIIAYLYMHRPITFLRRCVFSLIVSSQGKPLLVHIQVCMNPLIGAGGKVYMDSTKMKKLGTPQAVVFHALLIRYGVSAPLSTTLLPRLRGPPRLLLSPTLVSPVWSKFQQ